MIRILAIGATAALLLTGAAHAQTPADRDGPANKAVTDGQKTSEVPVAGRNSFTQEQARIAIEKAGYSSVLDLKKDDNGVWRGIATKDGNPGPVALDYQGNVNAAK